MHVLAKTQSGTLLRRAKRNLTGRSVLGADVSMAIEYQKTGRGSYYSITFLILSSHLNHRSRFSLHLAMIHISKVFGVSKLIYIHLFHSRS